MEEAVFKPYDAQRSVCIAPDRLAEAIVCVHAALAACTPVDEQLMSDIHGDSMAFDHLVRSASGQVRRFVEQALGEGFSSEEID